jgi:hypothetical protein
MPNEIIVEHTPKGSLVEKLITVDQHSTMRTATVATVSDATVRSERRYMVRKPIGESCRFLEALSADYEVIGLVRATMLRIL